MNEHPPEKDVGEEKWEFEDYAFTITGIIVGVLLVVPPLLYTWFGIGILGEGAGGEVQTLREGPDEGNGILDINQLRFLSPLLFLVTTTIVFFKDAFDVRKNGGYSDSWFTYDFESLLEVAIYLALTTITVFSSILIGAMWASWLAAPVSWILFVFILPLLKKKNTAGKTDMPWLCLSIFAVGIIAEVITGAWIAFPLSWIIICAIKLIGSIRKAEASLDTVYDISYSMFSVIVIAAGLLLNFWYTSSTALILALFVCWIFSRFKRFRKVKKEKRAK